MYPDHSFEQIDQLLNQTQTAFCEYKQSSLQQRAIFLKTIANGLQSITDLLVETAQKETNLSSSRLQGEIKRTIFQLTSYAEAAEKGSWLDARIDLADENATPPKPDLRKMLVPLGTVVVFGASNFPFAYSTAGGDTACALAAGCPVVVKCHPAHAQTSTLVANTILAAMAKCNMPAGVFSHVYGSDFKIGEYLVNHKLVKAVGFTGSYSGGRALFDLANKRAQPIPVFAEMGSTNPVFLLPDKLKNDAIDLADKMAKSITQDMGQFCTNPGIVVAVKGENLDSYIKHLISKIADVVPSKMLHKGIARNYVNNMQTAITQRHVAVMYQSANKLGEEDGMVVLSQVNAKYFTANKQLYEEVFGPYSILVVCNDEHELLKVAESFEGQLTTTLMATPTDLAKFANLVNVVQEKCGRFVLNNVPTGVSVALAMQHGGPFPSCTDSRFTAVGADGIKRFARPITFQNWDNAFLPDALKDENPLKIWRTVNNELKQ